MTMLLNKNNIVGPDSPPEVLEEYFQSLMADYCFFIKELWRESGFSKFGKLCDVMLDICRWAAGGEGMPHTRGALAPRDIGKTHFITIGITLWDLLRDNNAKVIIISKSNAEAVKTVFSIRQLINTVWFLNHLRPKKGQRDKVNMFDVNGAKVESRNPSVSAIGIEGQLESNRASRIIADDVETKGNTKTIDSRQGLREKVKEFTHISSYGKDRIGDVLYVGTINHEDTLYAKLNKVDGYEFRTWPLLAPHPDDKIIGLAPLIQHKIDTGELKAGTAPESYDGSIVFKSLTQTYINRKMAEGMSNFAMQCMLIVSLGDLLRYPLKLKDFIVFPTHRDKAPVSIMWGTNSGHGGSTQIEDIPIIGFDRDCLYAPVMFDNNWSDYSGTKMTIDPSGEGRDPTGYAITSHLNGYIYVKAVGELGGPNISTADTSVMNKLASLAREHAVNQCYIEDIGLQSILKELFYPVLRRYYVEPNELESCPYGWRCSLDLYHVKGQKEVRIISALEPVMNQHRLIIDPNVIRNEALQRQITRITTQRGSLDYDDMIDALAACVMLWQDEMAIDPVQAAQRDIQRRFDEEHQEHIRLATGTKKMKPRYFNDITY